MSKPTALTDLSFASDVEQSTGVVLVDLWADRCGPCKMATPVVEQITSENEGKTTVR